MTIVVEDGNGLINANSFTSVAFADTFFGDIGEATWAAAVVPTKEQKLIQATRYMGKRFGPRLKGLISSSQQGVEFPRDFLYDERGTIVTGVPIAWQRACCWYARHALDNDLVPPVVYPVADGAPVPFGRINRKIEKVGPVYEETYYSNSGANASRVSSGSSLVDPTNLVQYPEADLLVAPFLRGSRGVSR